MNVEKVVFDNFALDEGTKVRKGAPSFSEILKESINKVAELEKRTRPRRQRNSPKWKPRMSITP